MTDKLPAAETLELKPCPFCGGPATSNRRSNGYAEVGCEACYVWTSSSNSDEHMTVWNRRAAESRLISAIHQQMDIALCALSAKPEPAAAQDRPAQPIGQSGNEADCPAPAAATENIWPSDVQMQPGEACRVNAGRNPNLAAAPFGTGEDLEITRGLAPEPAGGMLELIRLLHQRYQDLGDTLARKAAWGMEELQVCVKELAEQLEKAESDLARSRYACDQTVERMEQEIARAQAPFAVRAEQAEAKLREAEKIREAAQDVVQAWQEPNFPSRLITALDAALAAQGEKP